MKKSVKILIGIIITLIILWSIVFAVDFFRCRNFKMPIFVVAGETVDDGGTGIYYGLGYKVNVEKSISAEYGVQLEKLEMYFFDKFIAGAITDKESKDFKMNYYHKKDGKIVTIVDKNINNEYDYNIYTYDGDVSFTFGTDMVYTFEEALKQKVITIEDILEQAKIDLKNGICDEGYFSDGGSTEYRYSDYTILKYNTIDGNRDLVIGPTGQIINEVNNKLNINN